MRRKDSLPLIAEILNLHGGDRLTLKEEPGKVIEATDRISDEEAPRATGARLSICQGRPETRRDRTG